MASRRRAVLFLLAMLLFGINAYCAETAAITHLKINFKEKGFEENLNEKTKGLKPGDYYQIIIDSINLNLYSVSITKKDTAMGENPAMPAWSNLGMGSISAILGNLAPFISSSPSFPIEAETRSLAPKPREKAAGEPTCDSSIIGVHFQRLFHGIKKMKKLCNDLDSTIYRYNELQWQSLSGDFSGIGLPETNGLTVNDLYQSLRGISAELNSLDMETSDSYNEFLLEASACGRNKNSEKFPAIDTIKKKYEDFIKTLGKAREAVSAENALKYINSMVLLLNNRARCYRSLPQQMTREQTRLKIEISPRSSAYNLQNYSTEIIFPPRSIPCWGYFWGVCTGFFLESGMDNEAYSVRRPDDSTYGFVRESPGRYGFGVNSLLQFGVRVGDAPVFAQVCFGPAVAVSDNVRPRLHIGGGFSFFERRVLSVNGGANIGYRDKLSNSYDKDASYRAEPKGYKVSEIKTGIFISLGYLFK